MVTPGKRLPPAKAEETAKHALNAALELFQRRWTLKLLWELRSGALTFRQLQAACDDVSASVLNQRLSELREALLVERDAQGAGYVLAAQGEALLVAIRPLLRWAPGWHAQMERSRDAAGPG